MPAYRILVEFEVYADDEDTALDELNLKLTNQTLEESALNYDITSA